MVIRLMPIISGWLSNSLLIIIKSKDACDEDRDCYPSFNQRDTLEQTIRSVTDQTGVDIVYCIADGGSQDGSVALIQAVQDDIDFVFWGPDKGQSDAINTGFKWLIEQGAEVLGWVNSDDYLLPGALAKVHEHFLAVPDVVAVSGQCHIVDKSGSTTGVYNRNQMNSSGLRPQDILLWDAVGGTRLAQPSTFLQQRYSRRLGDWMKDSIMSWTLISGLN